MKGNYRAFLFDLDGTLVDSAPDIGAALNHSLAAAGLSTVGDKLVRHWVGYGSRTLIRQALEYHHQDISDDLIEQLLTPFLEYYTEHITDLSQVYPGVHEVLGRLRNDGHPLGVVTNKLTQLTQPVLAGVALADYFSVVVCGDTTNNPKPAAAILKHESRRCVGLVELAKCGFCRTDIWVVMGHKHRPAIPI